MIKINVIKENNLIKHINISGHSGYAEKGKDIVCASVSSIVTTTVNSILRIDEDCLSYEEADGLLQIEVLKHDNNIDILIDNMLDLLKELSIDYPKYIKINL